MLKIIDKKRFSLFSGGVTLFIIAIIGGVMLWQKHKDNQNPENQPQVYEALVNIVDQKTGDPVEDARSSLKKGDVIAYFPEGHSWSDTEKNSYLIIKIKLKTDDAAKLLEAETKEVKEAKPPTTETAEGGLASKEMGPRMETVRARKYFLDLPDFDTQKFWGDQIQPFADRVFDDAILKKK
jgi:hypothetical protein